MGDPVARRRLVSIRLRQGRDRVRNAAVPVLVAAVAAGLAYAIAHYGLGHEAPVFAPIAAWVCLGFRHERELRRVADRDRHLAARWRVAGRIVQQVLQRLGQPAGFGGAPQQEDALHG